MIDRSVEVSVLEKGDTVKQMAIVQRLGASHVGAFAMDLVRCIAMGADPLPVVPWADVGEQAPHSQPYRLLTPQEVVTRSVEIARLTFDALEREGWITEFPGAEQMIERDGSNTRPGFGIGR